MGKQKTNRERCRETSTERRKETDASLMMSRLGSGPPLIHLMCSTGLCVCMLLLVYMCLRACMHVCYILLGPWPWPCISDLRNKRLTEFG